jgi:malonyl-CoA decarboxylase
MAPDGTWTLVELRRQLLKILPIHPEFIPIDADFKHLMASWFNRGFLRLQRIDWQSPAGMLEKLMAYEAVHPMSGWDDLRRRLASDRRCFTFFHPVMEDEPLIFVEVALTQGLADSVQTILTADVDHDAQQVADTAIFYSISDCQAGLKGISFGNFLIKQVVMELQRELPNLHAFATLSPMPGFLPWLRQQPHEVLSAGGIDVLSACGEGAAHLADLSDDLAKWLTQKAAEYLYLAKRGAAPLDPVARFHLRNGASIERLNWLGDTSAKGLSQALCFMVNYRYELGCVEARHEAFVNEGRITIEEKIEQQLNMAK